MILLGRFRNQCYAFTDERWISALANDAEAGPIFLMHISDSRPGFWREYVLHALGVSSSLVILWLVLSGQGTSLLLTLGAFSALLVSWLTLRMELLDPDEHPFHLRVRALGGYLVWLGWQALLANLMVARVVLSPRMPLKPEVLRVQCKQEGIGKVIHANSITLTPGTITIEVDGPWLNVHCLGPQDLSILDMRVQRLEGHK